MAGCERNGTGLISEDFFSLFCLRGNHYFAPKEGHGLFDSTVLSSAKSIDLLIPSLGDIVDFVCLDPINNGLVINKYLQENVLVTSSGIESTAYKEFIMEPLDYSTRKKKNVLVDNRRGAYFDKFEKEIFIEDKEALSHDDKNILIVVFNREYGNILSAMEGIAGTLNKKIKLPSYTVSMRALSLVYREKELLVCKHNICGGEFCFL